MRSMAMAAALVLAAGSTVFAQVPKPTADLLDRLVGTWVLQGTIDNKETTHDVVAASVLNGQYVQIHEVSRERDAKGRPEYEAIVYLTWEADRGEYSCLWLDSTGNGGISNGVTARAKPAGDDLRLLFNYPTGALFHTTFSYDRKADTWRWVMDGEEKGKLVPFARLTMRRGK
jgi:hypothetical protein